MSIQIPKNGFEIKRLSAFDKNVEKVKKQLSAHKSFLKRLKFVFETLHTNPLDPKLEFHRIYYGGEIKYNFDLYVCNHYSGSI